MLADDMDQEDGFGESRDEREVPEGEGGNAPSGHVFFLWNWRLTVKKWWFCCQGVFI